MNDIGTARLHARFRRAAAAAITASVLFLLLCSKIGCASRQQDTTLQIGTSIGQFHTESLETAAPDLGHRDDASAVAYDDDSNRPDQGEVEPSERIAFFNWQIDAPGGILPVSHQDAVRTGTRRRNRLAATLTRLRDLEAIREAEADECPIEEPASGQWRLRVIDESVVGGAKLVKDVDEHTKPISGDYDYGGPVASNLTAMLTRLRSLEARRTAGFGLVSQPSGDDVPGELRDEPRADVQTVPGDFQPVRQNSVTFVLRQAAPEEDGRADDRAWEEPEIKHPPSVALTRVARHVPYSARGGLAATLIRVRELDQRHEARSGALDVPAGIDQPVRVTGEAIARRSDGDEEAERDEIRPVSTRLVATLKEPETIHPSSDAPTRVARRVSYSARRGLAATLIRVRELDQRHEARSGALDVPAGIDQPVRVTGEEIARRSDGDEEAERDEIRPVSTRLATTLKLVQQPVKPAQQPKATQPNDEVTGRPGGDSIEVNEIPSRGTFSRLERTDTDYRPINSLTTNAVASAGAFPENVARKAFSQEARIPDDLLASRDWAEFMYLWEAPGLCHRPLYFEEANLERYGYSSHPICQPAVSAGMFFARVPALPYLWLAEPGSECVYTLGHYRPGSRVPYQWHLPPWKLRAGLGEAAVAAGMVLILP